MNKVLLMLALLVPTGLLKATGFISGTPVRTPYGFVAIEQCEKNDRLMCYVPGKINVYTLVKKQSSYSSMTAVYLIIEDLVRGQIEIIGAAPNQRLYSAERGKWVKAKKLKAGERLLTLQGLAHIKNVDSINDPIKMFRLTLNDPHTYVVGAAEIIVQDSKSSFFTKI